MNRLLTILLLTLLLVVNPLALLGSNFHSEIFLDKATKEATCHTADQESAFEESAQHVNTDCEMPCCQDIGCLDQNTCVTHYSSALLVQQASRLSSAIDHSDWGASLADVPDRVLPPDNPPPIHI